MSTHSLKEAVLSLAGFTAALTCSTQQLIRLLCMCKPSTGLTNAADSDDGKVIEFLAFCISENVGLHYV